MKEFYGSATYYGIGQIIKEYANFPNFIPLPINIQHGWHVFPGKHDARFDAVENWYWSKEIEQKYREKFDDLNTRVVGAPFLYLLKNLNYTEIPRSQRKGSIVFPSHSAALVGIECDFDLYADLLDRLPDEYKPMTVCMYYLDRDKGLDRPFLAKGFEVVSNGTSIYATSFLENYIINTQNKKYAFSNQMTSALLFASVIGLKSFFYGPQFTTQSRDPNTQGIDYNQQHRCWETTYSKYFTFPDCDLAKQQKLAAQELGKEQILSPSEMNSLLWRSILKKPYLITGLKQSIKKLPIYPVFKRKNS